MVLILVSINFYQGSEHLRMSNVTYLVHVFGMDFFYNKLDLQVGTVKLFCYYEIILFFMKKKQVKLFTQNNGWVFETMF